MEKKKMKIDILKFFYDLFKGVPENETRLKFKDGAKNNPIRKTLITFGIVQLYLVVSCQVPWPFIFGSPADSDAETGSEEPPEGQDFCINVMI